MSVKDNERYLAFSRRAALLSFGTLGAFGTIAARLYYLQVSKSREYSLKAEENRIDPRVIVPLRGRILDRFGVELASNQQDYRVILVPENAEDVEMVLESLAHIIPLNDELRQSILKKAQSQRDFVPIKVAGHLTWEEFSRVNVRGPELAGIEPVVGETRHYPYREDLSHVLGYVTRPDADDQAEDPHPLLRQEEFRIGGDGIERLTDKSLRGKPGYRHVEVNALGRVVGEIRRVDGQAGDDVVLTIDVALQKFAAERMRGESGSAVLMDIYSGDVLALVSEPGFDPQGFNRGWTPEQWKELLDNPLKPLINKSIAGQYPPGSTIKPMIALAALEQGVVRPSEAVFCSGKRPLGSHVFHCWKRHGHGWMDLKGAVKHSCDIYFYEIANRLGIDQMEEYLKRFGLGERYEFDLPGEKPGLVPSRGWKKATTGVSWQKGETLITGIGQGYLLATPLQLAVMTARFANGGFKVKPRLLRSVGSEFVERPKRDVINFNAKNLAIAQDAMNAVSNEVGGTAFRSRVDVNGMKMAGKTGTAQVRRITKAERLTGVLKNEELPWKFRDHALFVAFAPVKEPRYALAVVIEHGGSGSKKAAPIAKDIMEETLKRDPLRRSAVSPLAQITDLEGQG